MSVQRAQFEIPSTEYMEWIAYLDDRETNEFRREDYYFASIAAEVRRSYVKDPMKVKIESFLLKFRKAEKSKKTKTTIEERTKKAKMFWMGLMKTSGRKK